MLGGTDEFVKNNGYYAENIETGEILKNQIGVIRTNCMDCLDRTNFAQTKIFLLALQQIFEDAGVNLIPIFDEKDFKEKGLAFSDISKSKPIVASVNWYWADNGDAISIHYTGTNSTITRVMKEGKKGFLSTLNHKYQDVHRFVNNNFTDNFKEECIRMILARSKRSMPSDGRELWEVDEEKVPNLRIKVITWNLGNAKCDSVDELK